MGRTELVEKYRRSMKAQGFSEEEISETVKEFDRVMTLRPEMVETISNILSKPNIESWWVDQPAGIRMSDKARIALGYAPVPVKKKKIKVKVKTRGEGRKFPRLLDKEDKRKITDRHIGVLNKGRKPTRKQESFNRQVPR